LLPLFTGGEIQSLKQMIADLMASGEEKDAKINELRKGE